MSSKSISYNFDTKVWTVDVGEIQLYDSVTVTLTKAGGVPQDICMALRWRGSLLLEVKDGWTYSGNNATVTFNNTSSVLQMIYKMSSAECERLIDFQICGKYNGIKYAEKSIYVRNNTTEPYGGVTKAYVDSQDALALANAKLYADGKFATISGRTITAGTSSVEIIEYDEASLEEDGEISIKGVTFTASTASHGHTKSDISDFNHTHVKADVTDFSHTHVKADVTDFSHTHVKNDITDFSHEHSGDDVKGWIGATVSGGTLVLTNAGTWGTASGGGGGGSNVHVTGNTVYEVGGGTFKGATQSHTHNYYSDITNKPSIPYVRLDNNQTITINGNTLIAAFQDDVTEIYQQLDGMTETVDTKWDSATHPTLIVDYGITDAYIYDGTVTLNGNSIKPLLQSDVYSGPEMSQLTLTAGTVSVQMWNNDYHPTSVSGYEIYDVYITSNTVFIGDNSVTVPQVYYSDGTITVDYAEVEIINAGTANQRFGDLETWDADLETRLQTVEADLGTASDVLQTILDGGN